MHTREVDVAIIGAGTAGLNARREVDKAGAHPLLIESGPYGTTCARVGCMPSKLLIAASDVAHETGDASRFGIEVGDVRIDGVTVLERVRREPLAIAFTDPQMAIVGTPYRDLDRDAVEIGEVSFDDQGRARVMGRNHGAVRIYARRQCCTLLGAELFGPRVEHMAHLLAWAVQLELPVQKALEMPFYHPVLEEGLRTALRDLAGKLEVTGQCRCEDLAEAPGA